MKSIKHYLLIIFLTLICSCSFYSLKGTIPGHIKNMYISPIINKSVDQEVVDLLDDKLNELLPMDCINILFQHKGNNKRGIILQN